ncbi:MAG: PspC domain-containing protein [Balneolaceae bacterium]
MPPKLRKSKKDKLFLGVCGGIAEYLGWDPTIVRIIYAVLGVGSYGIAILFYFILAVVMPD